MRSISYGGVALLLATVIGAGQAVEPLSAEDFTFVSSFDGVGPIYATAVHQTNGRRAPMMVVQQMGAETCSFRRCDFRTCFVAQWRSSAFPITACGIRVDLRTE